MFFPLQEDYQDGVSSVSIHSLEQGQRYCIKVQYLFYLKVVGLASCTQCVVIPRSGKTMVTSAATAAAAAVRAFLILFVTACFPT